MEIGNETGLQHDKRQVGLGLMKIKPRKHEARTKNSSLSPQGDAIGLSPDGSRAKIGLPQGNQAGLKEYRMKSNDNSRAKLNGLQGKKEKRNLRDKDLTIPQEDGKRLILGKGVKAYFKD